MNMTKKILVGLAVAASTMIASAGVLYWQVEGLNPGDTFDSATLYVSTDRNATGATATGLATVSEANGTLFTDEGGTYSDQMQTDISAYSGNSPEYYFFVEMANYNDQGTKRGNAYSYSDLVNAGYVATSPFDSASVAAAAAAGNFASPTPEPTSGMLLLIGGSLLALRRRRRQA